MAKTATHITVDGERYDLQDAELAQDVSDLKSALDRRASRIELSSTNFATAEQPLCLGLEFENGTYSAFNVGAKITKSSTNASKRLRPKNYIVNNYSDIVVRASQGYTVQGLIERVSQDDVIGITVAYTSSVTIPSGYRAVIVVKSDDTAEELDPQNVYDYIELYLRQPYATRNDEAEGKYIVESDFESGTYTSLSIGDSLVRSLTGQYSQTRLKTIVPVSLPGGAIIACPDDYQFTVLKIEDGIIKKSTANTNLYNVETAGKYAIVFKRTDNTSVSGLNPMDVISVSMPTDNTVLALNFEYGSFASFSRLSTPTKIDASPVKSRIRTATTFKLEAYTELTIKPGYSFAALIVGSDNKLIFSASYTTSIFSPLDRDMYVVVKKDSGNIDVIPDNLFTTTKTHRYFDKNVAVNHPPFGSVYSPTVTVDAVKFAKRIDINVLLNAWQELADNSNGYLTVSSYGKDESGLYDILKVETNAGGFKNLTDPEKRPKMLIAAGVHGGEQECLYALYYLFADITNNWSKNPILEYLRWNFDFVIMPCVNPYGNNGETNSYYNYNQVNLNHNFDDVNHSIGYGADTGDVGITPPPYGSEPFSEKETQYMKTFFDSNTDAIYYLDLHATGQATPLIPGKFGYHDIDPVYQSPFGEYEGDFVSAAAKHLNWAQGHFADEYNLPIDKSTLYGTLLRNSLGGHAYSYSQSIGIYGQIWEAMTNLPTKTTAADYYSQENLEAQVKSLGQWIEIIAETLYKKQNND